MEQFPPPWFFNVEEKVLAYNNYERGVVRLRKNPSPRDIVHKGLHTPVIWSSADDKKVVMVGTRHSIKSFGWIRNFKDLSA